MKTIRHTSRSRDNLLHVETDLGIVNIRVGLTDAQGRRVEAITILQDEESVRPGVILWEQESGQKTIRLVEETDG